MKNVLEVDQKGLCLECGTCAGVCPNENISLCSDENGRNHILIKDENLCEKCSGICLKVCPGYEVDMDQLNEQVFGKIPENYWSGNYKKAFLGYSPDEMTKKTCASGGIVSTVLIHALETGMIQGVFLLTPQPGKPFSPVPVLATDKEAVLAAAGSFYWPAPIGQYLRKILHSDGKFAFVGLPCEIQALRKAQSVVKQLKEKIVFTVGLYCGGRPTIAGQKFAFERYGVDVDQVESIKYRQPEWPGHLMITMKNGEKLHVHKPEQLQGFSGQIFCHPRCVFCHDSTSELADISTGDAIRLEDIRKPEEKSLMVARSEIGLKVLESAHQANKLVLREVGIEKVVHSQQRPILHKKASLWSRIKLANHIFGKHTPEITMSKPDNVLRTTGVNFFANVKILLMSDLTSSKFFRKILKIVPMSWLKKYSNFSRYS